VGRKTFVLLVSDPGPDLDLVRDTLEKEVPEVSVTEAHSREAFHKMLDVATYEVVLTSHKLRDLNGLEVVDELRRRGHETPVVLLVQTGTENVAVEAMKRGVRDYVIQRIPFIARLPSIVQHAAWMARFEHVTRQAEADRRKLEKQLFQARRMEALDTLASGVAHDLNNILLAIFGYGELMKDEIPEGAAAARENLDAMLQAADRARKLVGQILTFSREGGRERRAVDIGSIVRETLIALRPSIRPEIVIREHLDARIGTVHADEAQVRQVVINLVTNAADAMKDAGGLLEVAIDEVDVDEVTGSTIGAGGDGQHVRLSVRDTGHGMDDATRERIFDPFFTTKGAGGGVGLGLSVVYGVVRSHGGAVEVESRRGKGTVMHVYLPVVLARSGSV
jgi:signal transduction histidine kinase